MVYSCQETKMFHGNLLLSKINSEIQNFDFEVTVSPRDTTGIIFYLQAEKERNREEIWYVRAGGE